MDQIVISKSWYILITVSLTQYCADIVLSHIVRHFIMFILLYCMHGRMVLVFLLFVFVVLFVVDNE